MATDYWPIIYGPSQDSGPGQLLFLRERTLVSQPFDENRLKLLGEPLPVAEQISSFATVAFFSASTNGVLAYRIGGATQSSKALWFDRQGKALDTAIESGSFYGLSLSPNGAQAAVGWSKPGQSSPDVWLIDLSRGTNSRFTFGPAVNSRPLWSPDGTRISFASNRDGAVYNLYQKLASGARQEELLLKSNENKYPTSWSSDGRFLLYSVADPKAKADLWVLPLEGERKAIPFLQTEFSEFDARFSPDMRWVAYVSDESGRNEIYVRGFSQPTPQKHSETGGKWQLSKEGGTGPRWRTDGKELYFRAPDGNVMVVGIAAGTIFQPGTPRSLFQAPPDVSQLTSIFTDVPTWDVNAAGDRFILAVTAAEGSPLPFTVVLNWTSLLKK